MFVTSMHAHLRFRSLYAVLERSAKQHLLINAQV